MNKFEALYLFAAWPPEHQRLCAEYWIETGEGEDRPAVAIPKPDEPFPFGQPVSRQVIQCNADSFPFDQTKTVLTYPREAAKVAAVKKRKHHSKQAWSAAESEYLLKLASEDHPMWLVVDCFLEKYPGRSSDAIRRRTWGIRSGKPESEVKY